MAYLVSDLLTGALAELRIVRAGTPVSPEDMALALQFFNGYLDLLNANGRALYTTAFPTFPLTAGLQPHTIGTADNTPTFTVAVARPSAILHANLVLTGGTTRIPLRLRDDDWWMNVRARLVTGATPTDLFYATDYPNGAIYLWPVPSAPYQLELECRTLLAALLQTDPLALPVGYQEALRLTMAERLAPAFGQTVSDDTRRHARQARDLVWSDNDGIPDLVTRDAGMPGGRGGYNFLTGGIE